MIVVSDTSCLCYLARLRCASVLTALFGKVIIPPAVAAELLAGLAAHPEIDDVLQASWLEVRTLSRSPLPDEFSRSIDVGEAEALVLAQELKCDHLLVDDLAARQVARDLGIPIIGVLGVLARARRAGHIVQLRPLVSELTDRLGFRASPHLVEEIIKEVGE